MIKKIKSDKQKYFKFTIYSVILLLSLIAGCKTVKPTKTKRFNPSQNAALKDKMKIIEKTVSNQDTRISDLSFQMKQLIETNNTAVRKINKLSKENIELKKKIAQLERNSMLLADNLDKERNVRTEQNNRLVNDIVKKTTALINSNNTEINKMLSKLQQTNRYPSRRTDTASLPKNMRGNFYEYKVQPGATLLAIAKAYKVTVAEIKRTNNLKNDRIKIGQKLYIPKK